MNKLTIDCSSGETLVEPLTPEDESLAADDAIQDEAEAERAARHALVLSKIDSAIATLRNELTNWPADLPNNANASTIVGRVNQVSAQVRRNTERIGKLAQLARGLYDVEE